MVVEDICLPRPPAGPPPTRSVGAQAQGGGRPNSPVTRSNGHPASNDVVVATYDRFATVYDWIISPIQAGTRSRALDQLVDARGGRVLEVGCGPGRALVDFAERVGPAGHVVGLDAAPGMVRRAHRRIHRADLDGRVDVILGDARSLPLPDGVVDIAFVEDTLELFSPAAQSTVLGELHRVLATDGRLGIVTMEREGAEEDRFVRAYDWAFDHLPGARRFGCRPIHARQRLEACGFAVERAERRRRAAVWPVDIVIARPV